MLHTVLPEHAPHRLPCCFRRDLHPYMHAIHVQRLLVTIDFDDPVSELLRSELQLPGNPHAHGSNICGSNLAHSCWARAFNDRHGVPGSHESAGIGSNRGRDHHHIRVPEPNEINDVNASPNFATDHHSLSPPLVIGCFMTSTYRPIPSAQGRIHSSLRCLHAMLCHMLRVRALLRFSPSTP